MTQEYSDVPAPTGWDVPGATAEEIIETDIVIVGSGMGGGTLAYALRNSGHRVLLVERGGELPREPENSDMAEVHTKGRYKNADTWYNGVSGAPFKPGNYYYVGGNTKVYGACLPRFRASDFEATEHLDGISPAWPFRYDDLEPYYAAAEKLYDVHGEIGEDPTEPHHSGPFPFPALDHEPRVRDLADSFRKQGLHPFRMASGMNLKSMAERHDCTGCDGAPCRTGAKADSQNHAIDAALSSSTVDLLQHTLVRKLITDPSGRKVVGALALCDGKRIEIRAKTFVLAAGAVNSAVVMLRSATEKHPEGLGNSSGLLGRNYMVHDSTFMVALDPRRINGTEWQKTLGLNDWYEKSATNPHPLGNIQMLGKLRGPMLRMAAKFAPNWLLEQVSRRTMDLYLTTEDLPRVTNGVRLVNDKILIFWDANNLKAHAGLTRKMKQAMHRAGYPFVFTKRMGIETNSHQCGTAVAGNDAATSVLDADCRAHDVENLFVVDSAFFPSSAALNPALTIAANALRVAPVIASSTDVYIAGSQSADPASAGPI